tara:strand:+ start:1412 stop:1903 length:492 start_codon:yes stop_codon:yes gene_type:complete
MQAIKMSLVRNYLLLFIALIFVISSTLISLNIIYKPFNSAEELYVSGRTLFIKLQEPRNIQNIANSNQKIISLKIEIINAASTELLLSINEKSADFLSVNGYSYDPLNPKEVDLKIDDPLWGNFKLNKNQMVKGNLIFKVKNSFEPKTFEWIGSDRVIINFSQ